MSGRRGFVYIFSRADGLLKLGWTINVKRRRTGHVMATGIQHKVERVWEMGDWSAVRVEGYAHYGLKDQRVRGHSSIELYQMPIEALAEAVEAAIERVRTEPHGLEHCYP